MTEVAVSEFAAAGNLSELPGYLSWYFRTLV